MAATPHRPARIRAVVFDFGGVLITTITNQVGRSPTREIDALESMLALLLGHGVDTGDHPWHRAERGELAIAEIQALLAPWAARGGVALHGDEIDVLLAAGAYSVVDADGRPCRAAACVEGVRTALLTNTFAEFRATMRDDIDLALFDA